MENKKEKDKIRLEDEEKYLKEMEKLPMIQPFLFDLMYGLVSQTDIRNKSIEARAFMKEFVVGKKTFKPRIQREDVKIDESTE